VSALDEWREALASWALPEEILARTPASPWTYPVSLFRRSAEEALTEPPSLSNLRALEALPQGGTVLDVGSGAGAASLPLSRRAGRIVAVDTSEEMLAAFSELADGARVAHAEVFGPWPDSVADAEPADVVVCNHVLYNVADLEPFVRALSDHALRRVVVEITEEHPRAWANHLWKRFHHLDRPDRPTAEDAAAVLREMEIEPQREDWTPPPGAGEPLDEIVALVRERLCLTPDRDGEIIAALGDRLVEREGGWVLRTLEERRNVTLWWDPSASP